MNKKLSVICVEKENKVVLKRGGIFKSIVWVTKNNFTISFVRNVKVTVNFKMLPKKEQEVFYVRFCGVKDWKWIQSLKLYFNFRIHSDIWSLKFFRFCFFSFMRKSVVIVNKSFCENSETRINLRFLYS